MSSVGVRQVCSASWGVQEKRFYRSEALSKSTWFAKLRVVANKEKFLENWGAASKK